MSAACAENGRDRRCGAHAVPRSVFQLASVAVLAAALARPEHASAQVDIVFEATGGCPALEPAVAALLGPRLATETARVVASVVRDGSGEAVGDLVLTLGAEETRSTFRDPSCSAVIDAMALVVAIALDPELLARDTPVEPEPPLPEPTAEPIETPDTETPEPPTPPPRFEGIVRGSGSLALGLLPDVGLGVELAVGLRIDGWIRIELSGQGVFPQTVRFRPGGEVSAEVDLLWLTLGGCLVPTVIPQLALGGCVGVGAGAGLGVSRGIPEPVSASAPLVLVEAVGRVEWTPVPEITFVLAFGLLAPLVRPVFTIDGLGRLYRPEPGDGTLRLGLELHFS